MKSAVIYARYSCDAQTEQSIEGQLRVCQEYAERNGILILDTYIDRAHVSCHIVSVGCVSPELMAILETI